MNNIQKLQKACYRIPYALDNL